MRISDWSSDVCSSDLQKRGIPADDRRGSVRCGLLCACAARGSRPGSRSRVKIFQFWDCLLRERYQSFSGQAPGVIAIARSEEHTSELQSLMRISYAVFCLKKKKTKKNRMNHKQYHHTH